MSDDTPTTKDNPVPDVVESESKIETKKKKIYLQDEKRIHARHVEDDHIPNGITRDNLATLTDRLFDAFREEQLYDTRQFLKHFGDKRALVEIPVPSLLDHVKNTVNYDAHNQIDVRLLIITVIESDRPLLIDLCNQVGERFVNNTDRPKSPLTLMQFKVMLAYRMSQLGF